MLISVEGVKYQGADQTLKLYRDYGPFKIPGSATYIIYSITGNFE